MSYVIQDPLDPRQILIEEGLLVNVHSEGLCRGRHCTIHRPTDHHMRSWPLHWRDDRKIFERTCQHGIGHPDPDQEDHWRETNQMFQSIHGCDFCCATTEEA